MNSESAPADGDDVRAKLMLVLLCCVWGTSWPTMKIALEQIPPFSMRAASAALGALTLNVVCLMQRRHLRLANARTWAHVFVAAVLNIVGFSLFSAFAQLATATSRVAIVAYTLPIWSVLLGWLFLGDRPDRIQAIALGLCAVGLAVLIYPLAATGVPLGVLWAIGTAVSWSAGTIYMKWARIQADPMIVASWQITIAFVILTLFMLAFEGWPQLQHARASGLWSIAFVGIGGNGIAYGLWFAIVRRLSATTASLGVLGSPVIGVVASVLILGDRPTLSDIVGFALTLAASACVLLARQERIVATP